MIKVGHFFFGKVFKEEAAADAVASIGEVTGRRVVIIDHPPTGGLVPFIEGLLANGAEVFLRDHHGDSDAAVVARCRELLGERAGVSSRDEHPACSTLLGVGEFSGDIIIADADPDGVTSAMKAAGWSYDDLDADAAVMDGPAAGRSAETLSPLGWLFNRAWGAIPPFGDRQRDGVFSEVVEAFASAISGKTEGRKALESLAEKFEQKAQTSRELAASAAQLASGIRLCSIPEGIEYDGPTLAAALDKGVLVSGRRVFSGPIAKVFGAQVSLARTKDGEKAGIDLARLAEEVFGPRPEKGWGPEDGVISNTPFLLHLSPDKWEAFLPLLREACEKTS